MAHVEFGAQSGGLARGDPFSSDSIGQLFAQHVDETARSSAASFRHLSAISNRRRKSAITEILLGDPLTQCGNFTSEFARPVTGVVTGWSARIETVGQTAATPVAPSVTPVATVGRQRHAGNAADFNR